jgi:hypothetical protein
MYNIHKDARQKEHMLEEGAFFFLFFSHRISKVPDISGTHLYMAPKWRGIVDAETSNARISHTSTQAS